MSFSTIVTLYSGFTHALETDHLLAVSNIVTQRKTILSSAKDGIYWGAGHTITILLIGAITIVFKMHIAEHYFSYFEALVGLMLMVIGTYRFLKFLKEKNKEDHSTDVIHEHPHIHPHQHNSNLTGKKNYLHLTAFSIGLIHGLAGSGSLILLVVAQIKDPILSIGYLLLFGLGSILGMFIATGLFSFPFSKKILNAKRLQHILIVLSAILCMFYGGLIFYTNLIA